MRHERQISKVTFSCDYCGYAIGSTSKEDELPIVLRVGAKMYHFHKLEEGVDLFDHTKSCIAKWFLAQYHLYKVQWKEGTVPQTVYKHPERRYEAETR